MPGGIIRVVAFLLFVGFMVVFSGVLHDFFDWLVTALGWPASGR